MLQEFLPIKMARFGKSIWCNLITTSSVRTEDCVLPANIETNFYDKKGSSYPLVSVQRTDFVVLIDQRAEGLNGQLIEGGSD